MPNEIIRTEFINKVRSALTSARNVAQIDHPGVWGKAREIFVQDMLRPILPPGSGGRCEVCKFPLLADEPSWL
jgi:hypothetical protein